MLNKFAIALIAASVFTAPVLAQGNAPAAPGAVAAAPAKSTAGNLAATKSVKQVKHVSSIKHLKRHKHVVLGSKSMKLSKVKSGKRIHTARAASAKPAIRSN